MRGPRLNAVIELNPRALADAEALDAERKAGKIRGPLHGLPVLIKDNVDVAGLVNSAGSLAMAEHRPKQDAFLVTRLRGAGAVILGKTNLSEWANFRSNNSSSGWSSRGGQTKNPYALDRNPCGSSSGTGTAIAASLAAFGVGTETDGSIICPVRGERARRPQADRGPGQPPGHHSDLRLAGHRRADGAHRRGRGAVAERPGCRWTPPTRLDPLPPARSPRTTRRICARTRSRASASACCARRWATTRTWTRRWKRASPR